VVKTGKIKGKEEKKKEKKVASFKESCFSFSPSFQSFVFRFKPSEYEKTR